MKTLFENLFNNFGCTENNLTPKGYYRPAPLQMVVNWTIDC